MISIIIITYNSSEYIYRCVESILKSFIRDISIEIIIIDNNSNEKIGLANSIVKVYHLNRNIGYSKALNFGIGKAKFENIITVNPDTYILKDTIRNIYSYFTSLNKESIVGCKILNYDSSFQYSSRRKFPYFKYLLPYGLKFKWFGIVNKYNYSNISENVIHQVDCISGSFMIFPKSLFEKLDGFDERFFLYFEDTDFCTRAKKIGADILYYPEAIVYHRKYGSTTSKNYFFVRFHFYKSFIKFYLKYFYVYFNFNKKYN
jgi:GT2 family glycosyltransferase